MALYNYIGIEGVIGAGKSTLARNIANALGARCIEENFEENPFLKDFYKDPERYAFQAQIFFLLARFKQLSELHSFDLFHEIVVADYIFDKDKIFANLNLNESELRLYEEVEKQLAINLPKPNLVIYLQASAPVLMKRINKRGRPYEKRIREEYIENLVKAYDYYFFNYEDSPLLVVNVDLLDLSGNKAFSDLLARINRPIHGVEFYNPGKTFWG